MENMACSTGVGYYLYIQSGSSRKIANDLTARNRCCKRLLECIPQTQEFNNNNIFFAKKKVNQREVKLKSNSNNLLIVFNAFKAQTPFMIFFVFAVCVFLVGNHSEYKRMLRKYLIICWFRITENFSTKTVSSNILQNYKRKLAHKSIYFLVMSRTSDSHAVKIVYSEIFKSKTFVEW